MRTNMNSTKRPAARMVSTSMNMPSRHGAMLRLVGWCLAHRRRVFAAWIAVAIITTIVAGAVGRHYTRTSAFPGQSRSGLSISSSRSSLPRAGTST